jgi:hypothetical protein
MVSHRLSDGQKTFQPIIFQKNFRQKSRLEGFLPKKLKKDKGGSLPSQIFFVEKRQGEGVYCLIFKDFTEEGMGLRSSP